MSSKDQYVIQDRTGKRRVTLYKATNGAFTFLEEHFSDDPLEQCWIPIGGRQSMPLCDTFETALREARARVTWLDEQFGTFDPTFEQAVKYIFEKNAELYRRLA